MKAKHLWTSMILLTVLAVPAFGESMWVRSATVDLRTGKGAVFPVAGTVAKGAEVTVLTREGTWVQVSAGGRTGWVFEGSLSRDRVGGDINLMPGATAEMGTGIAARGLQPGAEAYVRSRGVDKRPLERLIALRQAIPPGEWVDFTKDVHR